MVTVLEKESFIESELKKYNITDAYIAQLSEHYMALTVKGVDDQEGYKVIKKARIEIKTKRVEVKKKHKDLKAESLRFGRAVDNEAKRIIALLSPIEEHLISQEKIVDDEKERIKTEKETEERERIERDEAEREKEEEARQFNIREEQRVESERLEKIRIEQEEKEAKIKAAQDKIDVDKRFIAEQETEKKRQVKFEQAKEEAVKQARIRAEDKAQRELEAKEKAEKQAEKDEKLRLALLPDTEKLIAFARAFRAIPLPSLSNNKSHNILTNAIVHLKKAYEILTEERR